MARRSTRSRSARPRARATAPLPASAAPPPGDMLTQAPGEFTGRYLVLLRDDGLSEGLQALKSAAGLKQVASAADFDDGNVDMKQAGDAEVFVLDKLKVAVVNADPSQAGALTAAAADDAAILAVEPERIMYALFRNSRTSGPNYSALAVPARLQGCGEQSLCRADRHRARARGSCGCPGVCRQCAVHVGSAGNQGQPISIYRSGHSHRRARHWHGFGASRLRGANDHPSVIHFWGGCPRRKQIRTRDALHRYRSRPKYSRVLGAPVRMRYCGQYLRR